MLHTQRVAAELERSREQFAGYQRRHEEHRAAYQRVLRELGQRYPTASEIEAAQEALRASAGPAVSLGARVTAEYDRWRATRGSGYPVLPFGRRFAHHEEARAWAECVHGTTTIAVDGSQILPWRDASVPLALVQAGIFENPHDARLPYLKDVRVQVLPPQEIVGSEPDVADARSGEALGYSQQVVHLRRFELEAETLIARMEHHASLRRSPGAGQAAVPALALFDGSLIVSFALKMPPNYRTRYVEQAQRLLRASEETRIPLLAYIDTSSARDVLTLLRGLFAEDGLPEAHGLSDAMLWRGALGWGDRTPAFISARDDLARMGYATQQHEVAFVYFQASADRPPARLEFPLWLVEAGLLDRVVDVVRAEVVAGHGYPYAIESADAVAVISATDRARFYTLAQEFATRHGLDFSISRKAQSKAQRRI